MTFLPPANSRLGTRLVKLKWGAGPFLPLLASQTPEEQDKRDWKVPILGPSGEGEEGWALKFSYWLH